MKATHDEMRGGSSPGESDDGWPWAVRDGVSGLGGSLGNEASGGAPSRAEVASTGVADESHSRRSYDHDGAHGRDRRAIRRRYSHVDLR